jgi:hypothetical protein
MANPSLHRYRSPPPVARSIRFAPLPDPRRSPSSPDSPPSPVSDDASSASSHSSPREKRVSYPIESYPVSPISPRIASISTDSDYVSLDAAPKTASSPRRSFLGPLFRRPVATGSASPSSSISLTPTPSIDTSQSRQASRRFHISAEDILTLGTIKLFRSASRNKRYSEDNDSSNEWELSRWNSVNSAQSAPLPSLNNASILGRSLARSQNAKPPVPSLGNSSDKRRPQSTGSATNGTSASASNNKRTSRRGVRMLNGRVYGAQKLKSNPFDNVRDEEADPAFVEWGYGGMGSVSGRRAAGMGGTRWERLQSGQNPDEPSLDDGSGMGWAKKRREARERGRVKEQETDTQTADSRDASTLNPRSESSTTAPVANPEANGSKSSINHPPPSPNIARPPSPASTSTPPSTSVVSLEGEHVLHAVTIPANFQHHHHHRSSSKGTLVSGGNDEAQSNTPDDRRVENQSDGMESEESEQDNDDEDTDSSGFGESKRITALSAGVEKYTRHKETISPISE